MRKGSVYCALDISEGNIIAVLARVNRAGEIFDIECQLGALRGIKDGVIVNLGMLVESISSVVNKLKNSSGYNIKSACVSVCSGHIFSRHSVGLMPVSERANKVINSSDIHRVNEQAYSLGVNLDEEILHQIPQGYIVDNQNKVLNPEGLYGHRLELDLLLIGILAADLESMVSVFDQVGVSVSSFVLSGLATSLAVTNGEVKEKGCCLLDIGYNFTQLLFFKDGVLRGMELFNFGWSSLVEALSSELKVSYELAEDITASYAAILSVDAPTEQEVLIKKDEAYKPIKRKIICSVIEKRLQEMFACVKEKIDRYYKNHDLSEGVIACGRVALMEGFLESLESCIDLPVRLAKIEKAPLKDLTYAAAIGLIKHSIALTPKIHPFKLSSYGNIFQRITRKSKEVYQEYF